MVIERNTIYHTEHVYTCVQLYVDFILHDIHDKD